MKRLFRYFARTLSARLSLMVVQSIAVLLTASVSILLYYSRMAMKDEAFHDASQTLAGTVLNIDNILLCVEQATGNIYWNVLQHLDEPERMTMYCRELLESTPYISGVAIAMEPNYYKERDMYKESSTFFEIVIEARTHIQKGDEMYENEA